MDQPNLSKLLKSNGSLQHRQKGQLVHTFDEREKFYYLKSGYIKRYLISNEGSLGVQSIYGPGYFFPLSPIFTALFERNSVEETYYYEAMTTVQAYCMDVNLVVDAMRDNPDLYPDLLFESWRRLQSNISQLENMSLKSALKKVAHGLSFLSKEFGVKETSGTTLQLPMVYQDLASVFGLTRETIARSMSSLKSQGLISIDRERRISVPDVEALQVMYK